MKKEQPFGCSLSTLYSTPASHAGGPRFEPARFHQKRAVSLETALLLCSIPIHRLTNPRTVSSVHFILPNHTRPERIFTYKNPTAPHGSFQGPYGTVGL